MDKIDGKGRLREFSDSKFFEKLIFLFYISIVQHARECCVQVLDRNSQNYRFYMQISDLYEERLCIHTH